MSKPTSRPQKVSSRKAAAAKPVALEGTADLLGRIRSIWLVARAQAARSVNTAHVCANWLIGQQIVEAEQGGDKRAGYGKALLKTLSEQLAADAPSGRGVGFSVSALQYMRAFYLAYPELPGKQHAVRVESGTAPNQHAVRVDWPDAADAGSWLQAGCTRRLHGRTTARC